MFEQYIADGASLFITIFACIVGLVSAISFIDFENTKKNEPKSLDED